MIRSNAIYNSDLRDYIFLICLFFPIKGLIHITFLLEQEQEQQKPLLSSTSAVYNNEHNISNFPIPTIGCALHYKNTIPLESREFIYFESFEDCPVCDGSAYPCILKLCKKGR